MSQIKMAPQHWIGVATIGVLVAIAIVVVATSGGSEATATAEAMKGSATARPRTSTFGGLGSNNSGTTLASGSAGAEMQMEFGTCYLENQMGDEPVLSAPPGVQPGTLISPPFGEVPVAPLYDAKYGFKSNFQPDVTERMDGEDGASDPANGGSFSRFKSKESTIQAMRRIADKFDLFFGDTLFPGAVVEQRGDGTFFIKDVYGRCVFLENYYDYVSAVIATEMGNKPETTLNWAKGSGISLRFADLDKNVDALRIGLAVGCESAAGYRMKSNHIKSLATDTLVKYDVKWPEDQSLLMSHYASFE